MLATPEWHHCMGGRRKAYSTANPAGVCVRAVNHGKHVYTRCAKIDDWPGFATGVKRKITAGTQRIDSVWRSIYMLGGLRLWGEGHNTIIQRVREGQYRFVHKDVDPWVLVGAAVRQMMPHK